MINLAVINLKELLNLIFKIFIGIIILIIICNLFVNIKNGNYLKIEEIKGKNFYQCLNVIDKNFLISKYYNSENIERKSGIKRLLVSELTILGTEEELMEKENQEEVEKPNNETASQETVNEQNLNQELENNANVVVDDNSNLEQTSPKLATEIISSKNKIDKYTDVYKTVKIKNESKYTLTEEILTPNVDFKNKNIIIYHTHTCESYTPTDTNQYEASGNYRTTDLNYNVVRVGTELTNYLRNLGFNVYHDTTFHDYPAYTGSYTRSLSTIKNIISNNDSEFIIDLHRDALGSNSDYGPSVKIGDEVAAQVMFVMGTDGGGLEHENWINNLKLAIKIQEKANEMYPDFFKPIILRNSRYNQHVSTGACIIEVGATGNTLEQCITSMKYLSKVIEEVMK